MRLRYTGPLGAVDLAFSGATIRFDRNKWVDIDKALTDAHVPLYHLEVVARGLGDEWETDDKKSRKEPAPAPSTPAKPDEESA